jgi:c-di-GMP-binding flagellar brake protein YcgR
VITRVGGGGIVLSFPRLGALPEGVEPGCRIAVKLKALAGAPVRHTIALSVKEAPPPSVEVAPLTVDKPQRRAFFRVGSSLSVTCFVLGQNGEPIPGSVTIGVVENISAGGLRIVTDTGLPPQARVRLRLDVPAQLQRSPSGPLEAEARVRRIVAIGRRMPPQYVVALQLWFDREAERDKWARLVFDLQRAHR